MSKIIFFSLLILCLCFTPLLGSFAAESTSALESVQGKWSVTKTNRENQRYSQTLEFKQGQFTFQRLDNDGQVRLMAKGKVQAEKAGPFEILKLSDIQGGRSAEELAPVDDTRAYVYAVREGKLILASNFDKERGNEAPGVDTYDRVATPKEPAANASSREDKLLGNWKVDVSMAEQNIDYGLRIAKADGKIAATLISPRSGEHKAKSATYNGEELVMEFDREVQGNSVTLIYKGKLAGDDLSGTVTAKGFEDQYSGKWKAKKN